MDTRKAVLQVGTICFRVILFVALVLGLVYLGQTTYKYTRAVFSDEAYEAEPGKKATLKIPARKYSQTRASTPPFANALPPLFPQSTRSTFTATTSQAQ